MPSKHDVLKRVFGHTAFRNLQESAVDALLERRDLLMILPTGGGKSLCYQLPSLMMPGVTVVVSPLLALMQDQVQSLKLQGVEAEMISSMQTADEIRDIYRRLYDGSVKLLYVAPERLNAGNFVSLLEQIALNFFVIDEAHCVSEWGHEFRDDYRRLAWIRERFANVPVAAFTATATLRVEADIAAQLQLSDPVQLRGSVVRSNLTIHAEPRIKDGRSQLLDFLGKFSGDSGIVYTFTRNATESLAAHLQSRGIKALAYHAGLETSVRRDAYHAFTHDEVQVIVATVAFGMGIDKSNIRFVVHMTMPKTLENYYQEIGRAGRDGLDSQTLLLYSGADMVQRRGLIDQLEEGPYKQAAFDKLERMIGYCQSESCRHQSIASYFDDTAEPCGSRCDNCLAPPQARRDITIEAQKFLSTVYRTGQTFGKNHLLDVLLGSKNQKVFQNAHDKLSVYGIGTEHSRAVWERILERLMELGALARGEHRELRIGAEGWKVLKKQSSVEIREDRLNVKEKRPVGTVQHGDIPDERIPGAFEALRALRRELAEAQDVPAYLVFNDKTLRFLAAELPETKEQMLTINGVGEQKFERYGNAFLDACRRIREA